MVRTSIGVCFLHGRAGVPMVRSGPTRGRVNAVHMLFIRSLNELGGFKCRGLSREQQTLRLASPHRRRHAQAARRLFVACVVNLAHDGLHVHVGVTALVAAGERRSVAQHAALVQAPDFGAVLGL